MELTMQEKKLIKYALNERFESTKKRLDHLESIGVRIERDKVCKEYLEENEAIVDLLERFWNEE